MSKKKKQTDKDFVTLVEDPFGITAFERIEDAVKTQDEAYIKELEGAAEASAEADALDAKKELQAQIQEDQAIEAELEKERAAIESEPLAPGLSPEDLDEQELAAHIEALLFVSDKPLSENKIRSFLPETLPQEKLDQALAHLTERYAVAGHGIELVQVGGGYQFRTKPGKSSLVKKLAKIQPHRLSRGAMETLAMIAYRQPLMKEEIDQIRGVDSSYFLRGLLEKNLIKISGRSELPGRPILYGTTPEFLEVFGLNSLADLPPLKEVEQMLPSIENKEEEDPKVKQMRKLVSEMNSNDSLLGYDPKEDEAFLTEIRERVKSIPTSTAFIDEQKEAEKQAKEAKNSGQIPEENTQPGLESLLEQKVDEPSQNWQVQDS